MKPLQISADTAVKLAAKLKVPVEHLMHMPQHILMQKLAELAASMEQDKPTTGGEASHNTPPSDGGAQ